MNIDHLLIISSVSISIVTALGLGVGLFLNWLAIKENNKTRQLKLLNDSFNSIKENKLILYKNLEGKDEKTKRMWYSLHFNSVELFAFLVNEKFIEHKKLVGFFSNAIVIWYEDVFTKIYTQEQIKDNSLYPEFKKLYHVIKRWQLCRKAS